MCDGLYVDSTTEKAQTYMYTPSSFFQFQLDSDGAGMLQATTFLPIQIGDGNGISITQLENYVNGMINPLLANEDFNIMSGDILKAFGPGGIVTLPVTDENYKVVPSYNQEVMSQIENATILPISVGAVTVKQTTAVGTGYLISNPSFTFSPYVMPAAATGDTSFANGYHKQVLERNHLLNFHHSNVQPEEVMVATRLTNIIKYVSGQVIGTDTKLSQITFQVPTMGSEIIDNAMMWNFVTDSANVRKLTGVSFWTTYYASVFDGSGYPTRTRYVDAMVAELSAFDWHPQIMVVYPYLQGANVEFGLPSGLHGDIDYYTPITSQNLVNMSTAALLSQFTIPNT